MPSDRKPKLKARNVAALLLLYFLSSGPVIATAFWLEKTTGWDGFSAIIWLYPIAVWRPVIDYVNLWAEWFGVR